MHELSIAHSLVGICEDSLRGTAAERVLSVHVRLGPLAGVVAEALELAYEVAVEGTRLAGSRLVIEPVPLRVRCEACGREVEPVDPRCLRCPRCGRPTPEVVAGRELLVRAIDYEEGGEGPPPPAAGPRAGGAA